MAGKKQKQEGVGAWIAIVILFAVGLWPIALVMLLVKLFGNDGQKRRQAPPPLQTAAPEPAAAASAGTAGRTKKAVRSAMKSPAVKKSNAKWLKIIGAVLAVLVWRTDLRGISNFSTALLVVDLIVIFSPKIPGLSYTGGLGMTGWIKIPGIGLTFQPVELAKLITIFFMATLGSQYNGRIDTVRDYIKLCGMLSIPFLAVVAMGDLGSGLVVLVSGAIVICMSGARREWVLSTLALLVGLIALILALDSVFDSLLGHDVLIKQYQMNRLTVFIDPDKADSDDAYNLQQSLIAVGSGGFFGKGLGHATQSAGGFLPEFHTDFVFAFLSETFGFCGSFLLLCLYVLLIFSTIRVAFKCESLFLRLSCVGIVGMWAFQTFENIGMCIGMMPITGIPLPFISFGSSSMMIQLLTVGIVQSIWRHRSGAA